jgi:RNA polymerase sigma-70 factor (ECF subfamily)
MKPSLISDERFSALSAKFQEPVRRYILSLVRDPAEADDLTQETFLRVFRKLESLQDETKLSAWLYRIATNVCHDRFRQLSRRPRTVPLEALADGTSETVEPTLAADGPPLDQLLEQEDMSSCVQQYIEELPDSQRAVILLHDLEGMTNPEIAEMLGCSVGAVKIRLHRARAKLKNALESNCAFSTNPRGVFVCEPKPSASASKRRLRKSRAE